MHLKWLDFVVIAAYLAVLSWIGAHFLTRQKSREEYFLGGRQMHWILVGGSIMATLLSAITYLNTPGEMIRYGIGYFSNLLVVPLMIPVVITQRGAAHLDFYFEALALAEEVECVVVCDPSSDSRELSRKLLGGKLAGWYSDAAAMFSKWRPELAVVSMEAVTSPPAIAAALDPGCDVLAEKPACVRDEDFGALHRKAGSAGRHLLLALANRADPLMIEARRLVADGKIGKVYGLDIHLIADQTRLARPEYQESWLAHEARAGGGHLIWLGIHWLDLAMFVTGARIREVAGFTAKVGGQAIDVEDSAAMALRLDNGALCTLASAYYLDKGYDSRLAAWGSQGWLRVHQHQGTLEWYSTREPHDGVPHVLHWGKTNPYPLFVRSVARACLGLEPLPVTAEDSLLALRTVFACYRAARTGRVQTIPVGCS